MEKTFNRITEESMPEVAHYLKEAIEGLDGLGVILFFGGMGMGKTTLIRLMLNQMGVEENVNSPTFAIMNEYHDASHSQKFFHFDFYRLQDVSELDELGIDEIWGKEGHVLIEWADKFPVDYPLPQILVHFESNDPETRNITVRTILNSRELAL